jgi:hypothetical protein
MPPLPETSPEHYLTGTSAMTIPSEGTSWVDWHFVDTFINRKARFRIAGQGDMPDTSPLLGQWGVHECGDTLRRSGVELDLHQTFWAADRDRALLDIIIANVLKNRPLNHIRLDTYFDNLLEREHFEQTLRRVREQSSVLQDSPLLNAWMAQV